MRNLLAIAILFLFPSCINQRVDLIVHHAQIFTVNNEFSVAEAMAIQDGKIVAIGNNDDILKEYKSDSVVNANGASVYPGSWMLCCKVFHARNGFGPSRHKH